MTEQELKNLDRDYPYKIIQSGMIGTERFNCETQARKHFKAAQSTCLLSSYKNGVHKHLAYKFKI